MRFRRLAKAAACAFASLVATAPSLSAAQPPASVSDVTFISPSLGWMKVSLASSETGTLYRTTDGGRRWTAVDTSVSASMLSFRSEKQGEALVPLGFGACQAQFTAVRTRNGGRTWQAPETVQASDGPSALALAPGRALLLNGSCAGPGATLLAPNPGGGVWRVLKNFSLTKAHAKAYFSPTAVSLIFHGKAGFAAVAYLPMKNTAPPLILGYKTVDGGHAWHMITLGAGGLPAAVRSLSFTNAADGLASVTGRNGVGVYLYATSNGGRTWARTYHMAGATSATLDMVTPRVGYAAITEANRSAGSLLKTTDGGFAWHPISFPA